ncbi:hypothetical protein LC608_33660 [Nostoc sp. XA010]|uniref:hypothetical protein n=1 Tax=Nostoc sp. XA010 TaxID=2780407 RepID=UPI001E34A5B5|nr:hypothetical protein [Nostoc sp. XA010]MCC5661807.1 hypothetical protein [Nostoc sp. XA010]
MVKTSDWKRSLTFFGLSDWGLKTLTGKVITASGVKPTVKVIWPRDNFWIYGAIEPLTGDHNIMNIQN